MKTDFRQFYNLDNYLFKVVSKNFKKDGYLSAFDFFCIIIWKANRAKTKIAKKIVKLGYDDLESAIKALSTEIAGKETNKEKMRVLIEGWKFRLPMSSAILTVMYPEDFSVYDIRVCESLEKHSDILRAKTFDEMWDKYCVFLEDVKISIPDNYSLREKDAYLWGKSFHKQLVNNIESKFV